MGFNSAETLETIDYVVREQGQGFKLEDIVLEEMRDLCFDRDEILWYLPHRKPCSTDIIFSEGQLGDFCPFPAVFGHEVAGTIKAIGSQVRDKTLTVGDFVLQSINFCETCKFCKLGHPADCVEGLKLHFSGVRPDGSSSARLKNGETPRALFFGQSLFLKMANVESTCIVKYPYDPEDAARFVATGCSFQTDTCRAVLKTGPRGYLH